MRIISCSLLLMVCGAYSLFAQAPSLVSFTPKANANNVSRATAITVSFDKNISPSSLSDSSCIVLGSLSGPHAALFQYDASTFTATITPLSNFKSGDVVWVTLTRALQDTAGDSLRHSYSWSFTAKTDSSTGLFKQTSSAGVGIDPFTSLAVDVNNDGYADIVTVNNGDGTISILKNNKDGTFNASSPISVGANPGSVAALDLYGDGKMDLAVTVSGENEVVILKNDGTGSFTQSSPIAVGSIPWDIIAADVNGDGKADLVVTNAGSGSNSISILINQGNGAFQSLPAVSVGSMPVKVTAADLNGDGYIDLICTNYNSNNITLLTNNGAGEFAVDTTISVGSGPYSTVADNLFGNGLADLAVSNYLSNTISILKNNGNGSFTLSSTMRVPTGPVIIAATDVNGDGNIDLVAGSTFVISILANNGAGIFTLSSSLPLTGGGRAITPLDIDDDGSIDLAVTNNVQNRVLILKNNEVPVGVIPRTGLVAWYPFDGNANDSSGNSYHGTVNGATLTTDRFSNTNSAYSFNGTSSVIRFGDILDSVFSAPVAKFSISGWANTRSYKTLQQDGGYMMGKNAGGSGPYQWGIGHYQGLVLASVFSDTNGLTNYMGVVSPMGTNQWFHFVYIFDGSQPELQRLKLYINGQSSGDSVLWHVGTIGTTTVNTLQQFTFGASHARNNPLLFSNFYDGTLDDVRIYNGVLSDQEIQSLYHEGGWPKALQPGLVAYYPFNGNASDSSGYGFNGTVIGATPVVDRFGNPNRAYSFDGLTSTIRCGDILDTVFSDSVAKFSVSGWAESRAYGSFQTGGGFIIGKNAGGTYGPYQWSVSHVGGLLVGGVFSDTAQHNYVELACPMATNQWFHFVLVFDGSLPEMQRVKLYVNGKTSATTVYQHVGTLGTTTANSAQNLTIGATHAPNNPGSAGNFYNGNIDDIRIYNFALDSTSVQSLYHEGGWPKTITPGLVAYYPFNGNANDSSGNGYNGTVSGASLTTNRFGVSNSAYHFSGGASISIPELFPDTVLAFTFAAWVKKDSMDYNAHEILYKGLDQGEASLGITKTSNGTLIGFGVNLETGVYGAQNWYSINAPDTLKAKTYYFLVGRYVMGQKIDFFINGTLIGSTPVPSSTLAKWPGQSYSAIGVQPQFPTTTYWNGVIDDIRVYNRALDSATIQSLYHEGGWPFASSPTLELYYPFSGNAFDSSGNRFNGLVVNATLAADRFNHPNSAYYFNGTNSFIYVGDILDSIFSAPVARFSISGWAKTVVPGSQAGGGGFIMGKSGGGNAGLYEWGMAHYNDNNVYAGIYYDGNVGRYTQVTSTSVGPGSWFHFVYVYDGTLPSAERLKLYINASISLTITSSVGSPGTGTMNTAQPLTIGAGLNLPDSPNNYYNGYIDDIRIYSGVISDSMIQALFHEGGWQIEGVYRVGGDVPTDYELSSNFPNPFNPSTTIRFGVPVQSRVKIEIFNILGQRVTQLADTEVGPGYFERVWQANYSSGIYFCRIEAASVSDPNRRFVATRKMLLMK